MEKKLTSSHGFIINLEWLSCFLISHRSSPVLFCLLQGDVQAISRPGKSLKSGPIIGDPFEKVMEKTDDFPTRGDFLILLSFPQSVLWG